MRFAWTFMFPIALINLLGTRERYWHRKDLSW